MIILNTEKLPGGRGNLLTVQTHGGMLMAHQPKGREVNLKALRMDEIRKLREPLPKPPPTPRRRGPSAIGEAVRAQIYG